jgi:hypothetical protein
MDLSFALRSPPRTRQNLKSGDLAALLARAAVSQALSPTARASFLGRQSFAQSVGGASFHPDVAQTILNQNQGS